MEKSFKIMHVVKRDSDILIFDKRKIVDAILKAMAVEEYRIYNISHISKKLNLAQSDLISILTHARIEVIDNRVSELGIKYLVDREVGKIKQYFELSLANYYLLSTKEQRVFNAFLKRYGIKYRKIRKWEDLKIEAIRKDCYEDLTSNETIAFSDGKFLWYDETEKVDNTKSQSAIQLIRSSLMYNIKNKRRWIRFKPISNTTVAYILTHHFHIFTSDDSNSIHAAEQVKMFNLPQNAKTYILAA